MTEPLDAKAWNAARRKRRKRGCLLFVVAPLLVIGIVLGWSVLRLFGKPDISRNYVAEYNERIAQIPQEDRAWPLYKQAILDKLAIPMPQDLQNEWTTYPAHPLWPETLTYMQQLEPVLEQVRAAAARPEMGQEMSDALDPDIAQAEATAHGYPYDPMGTNASENPMLIGVLLPALSYQRRLAQDLSVDVYIAAENGDGQRAADDLSAMLGLAHHSASSQTLIGQLVQIAIENLAQSRLSQVFAAYPGLFTSEQLAQLQHDFTTIGRSGPAPDVGITRFDLDMTMERQSFYDILQRIYTDDGNGNGHMTLEGARTLSSLGSYTGEPQVNLDAAAMVAFGATRKQMADKYEEIMDVFEEEAAMHPWERGASASRVDAMVEQLHASPLGQWRYSMITLLMPALNRAINVANEADARRDAAITIIALHRYRLDHADFPQTLDQLVPNYLPALPRDPVDGQPLRYLRTPQSFTLYSLGYDKDDDQGRTPPEPFNAVPLRSHSQDDDTDGDWVFFPEAMPTPPAPDEDDDGWQYDSDDDATEETPPDDATPEPTAG